MAQTLLFRPLTWFERDEENSLAIYAYGYDSNNVKTCIRILNYLPYLIISYKIKKSDNIDFENELSESNTSMSIKYSLLENFFTVNYADKVISCDLISGRSLYYYQEKERLMMKIYVKNNQCKNEVKFDLLHSKIKLNNIRQKFDIFEGKFIKSYEQMLSDINCSVCEWLKINIDSDSLVSKDQKISVNTVKNEYIVDFKSITRSENQSYFIRPSVMAWDAEVYSCNNIVPNVKNVLIPNILFNISCVFSNTDNGDYNLLLTTIDDALDIDNGKIIRCNASPKFQFTKDFEKKLLLEYIPFDSMLNESIINEVICRKEYTTSGHIFSKTALKYISKIREHYNEYHLLLEFQKVIKEEDPDFLVAFNSSRFDIPYLSGRMKIYELEFKDIGRLQNVPASIEFESWKSSAAAVQEIYLFNICLRINIDLKQIISRNYQQLHSYSLNNVSLHFLEETKHDMNIKQLFEFYENKDQDGLKKVGEYCIQDSILVKRIFEKLNVVYSLMEMCNILRCSIEDIPNRGQQLKAFNQLYHQAKQENVYIESLSEEDKKSQKYKGANVESPVPGKYDDVYCLDFSSLYPSIMLAHNICYTTIIHPSQLQNCNEDDTEFIRNVEINENYQKNIAFMKKDNAPVNVLSKLLKNLLDSRKIIRKRLENDDIYITLKKLFTNENVYEILSEPRYEEIRNEISKNPSFKEFKECIEARNTLRCKEIIDSYTFLTDVERVIADQQQNAYKISANSLYGFLGTGEMGRLPLLDGSATVTFVGRTLFDIVKREIEQTYKGKVIYGDTDSCFFQLPPLQEGDVHDNRGRRIASEITQKIGKSPIKLEFEKFMYCNIITSKKHYFAIKWDSKNERPIYEKPLIKGIPIARRDSCKWLRDTMKEILTLASKRETLDNIENFAFNQVEYLCTHKVKWTDLVLTTKKGEYKESANSSGKIFFQRLENKGDNIEISERVEYVVCEIPSPSTKRKVKPKKGDMMFTINEFKEEGKHINIRWYIENHFIPAISKILYVCLKSEYAEEKDRVINGCTELKKFSEALYKKVFIDIMNDCLTEDSAILYTVEDSLDSKDENSSEDEDEDVEE